MHLLHFVRSGHRSGDDKNHNGKLASCGFLGKTVIWSSFSNIVFGLAFDKGYKYTILTITALPNEIFRWYPLF
jgi:hypothetical protein